MIDGCPFCRYQGPSPLLLDFGDTYIIEPTEPVVPGHVLVVPFAHHEHAVAAPSVFSRAAYVVAEYAREAELGACNIITSCGTAASQTVNHLHLHIVFRYPVQAGGAGFLGKLPLAEREPEGHKPVGVAEAHRCQSLRSPDRAQGLGHSSGITMFGAAA